MCSRAGQRSATNSVWVPYVISAHKCALHSTLPVLSDALRPDSLRRQSSGGRTDKLMTSVRFMMIDLSIDRAL